jgi:zinc and cadmium transporter
MHWWQILVLVAAPLVGGALAAVRMPGREEGYRLVLSFSGAFLFGVAVLHLFPIAFAEGFNGGIYVLAGFVLQLILEQLTQGIEHGHFHAHKSLTFVASLLIGLTVHSFFDGVPVYAGESHDHDHALLWAVSLHKIPEGYALVAILVMCGIALRNALVLLFAFALVAPLGTLFAAWIHGINPAWLQVLYGLVSGLILHVSTTILFESETSGHRFTYKKIGAVAAGILVAWATLLTHSH